MKPIKIGILAAGHIARKMAATINRMPDVEAYAVASRDFGKAQNFANEFGFSRAYGSYEEMLDDPNVELVYVTTPNSHHYEHARACLLKDKPVLCEKSFTATAPQAGELFRISRERNIFITEAIWTRYMPLSKTINQLIGQGVIGEPQLITANLCYPVTHKERVMQPELAGGALLDIGLYAINFASMIFGSDVKEVASSCQLTDTGVDGQETITLKYDNNRMVSIQSSIWVKSDRLGIISGTKGHMIVENINNPLRIRVVNENYETVSVHEQPPQISGFEYEVRACIEAINKGWIEHPDMPHSESLRIMELMDNLRKEWGVRYPWDNW